MEYLFFILFLAFLVLLIILISKIDAREKAKHKKDAYRLMELSDPNPKELKETIKGLQLYGGRLRKDKEAMQLIKSLQDKHGHLLY